MADNQTFRQLSKRTRHFRLMLLSIAVGVISGLGAILFDELLQIVLKHLVNIPTGYIEPGKRAPAAAVLSITSKSIQDH